MQQDDIELDLDQMIPTNVNEAVAEAMPKPLLVKALVDLLAGIRVPEELAAMTALPRARAAEIVNLRDLLTNATVVTRQ